jgi:hypothetical protein
MSGLRVRERIVVTALSGLGVPAAFHWRGRRHVVRRIEAGARRRELHGVRSFRLSTQEGLRCNLVHDTSGGRWYVDQVGGA